MARILITPRSLTANPSQELARLREAGHELVFAAPGRLPDEAELLRLVPGAAGWLAGIEPVLLGLEVFGIQTQIGEDLEARPER